MNTPLDRLKHHVTGAIERGEAQAITAREGNIYSYTVRHKNGWGLGFGPRPTHCATCSKALPVHEPGHTGGTGYGCSDEESIQLSLASAPAFIDAQISKLKPGEHITRSKARCYDCCAGHEKQCMIETGRATLYLVDTQASTGRAWAIQDWGGRLSFPVSHCSKGAHNMARVRYDVTFRGPDGKQWRGTTYGDNTQICHCRRLKVQS